LQLCNALVRLPKRCETPRANHRCKPMPHWETVFGRNREHGFSAPERVVYWLNRPIAEVQSERIYTVVGTAELVGLSNGLNISRASLICVT
jgi:hypothetical protein